MVDFSCTVAQMPCQVVHNSHFLSYLCISLAPLLTKFTLLIFVWECQYSILAQLIDWYILPSSVNSLDIVFYCWEEFLVCFALSSWWVSGLDKRWVICPAERFFCYVTWANSLFSIWYTRSEVRLDSESWNTLFNVTSIFKCGG